MLHVSAASADAARAEEGHGVVAAVVRRRLHHLPALAVDRQRGEVDHRRAIVVVADRSGDGRSASRMSVRPLSANAALLDDADTHGDPADDAGIHHLEAVDAEARRTNSSATASPAPRRTSGSRTAAPRSK